MAHRQRIPLPGTASGRCALTALLGVLAAGSLGGCRTSSGHPGRPSADVVSTADRRIRVRLDKSIPQFVLRVEGGCLIDNDEGKPLLHPLSELDRSVVAPDPDDPSKLRVGEFRLPGPVVRVLPSEDGTLVYNDRHYRGYLVARREGNGFLVINVVDIESYLRGVLRGELPRYFHSETYRAQAIVSRTYALYQCYVHGRKRTWDVTADTSSQVYRGRDAEASKSNEAVAATAGIVLAWDGPQGRKIFCTYFSSTCGGMNQNVENVKGGQAPGPLRGGVACKYCKASDWYRWDTVRLHKDRITKDVKRFFVNGGYTHAEKLARIEEIRVLTKTPNGRAIRLRLIDKNGFVADMRAEDFRLLIDSGRSIKSTHFDVVTESNFIRFENGRGYGHGIGLCQHGAEGMARDGIRAGQILQHYYPGAALVKAY